jgi:Ca2+-binding EF-hand superfamily protein
VQEGEPGLTAFALDSDTNAQPKARYAFESEKYAIQPPLIKQFIQAVRLSVMKRMVREGGTPFSIVRQIFMLYDLNYSSSLNAAELIPAMRKGMGLVFTEAHAAEIGKFYNRDGTGEFGYQIMLKDIVENFPSMLDFSATSASYISSNSKGNPFVKPEFHLKDNKTVESFRTRLLQLLEFKIAARGGSVRSLIRDAFIFWDSRCCGKLKSVQEVLGALKRLGVDATTDEAQLLMSRYDPENDGEMHYNSFIEDMARYELSFLSDTGTAFDTAMSPTARSPANVSYSTQLIRSKADGFARKSGGKLVARDILHGTFLKHDSGHQGRVSMSDLKAVCADLQVSVSDAKLQVLLSWFDSNGTNSMDYNAFIDQLYGSEGLDGTEKVKRATYHLLDHFKEGMMADSPATKKMSKRALKLKEEEERRTASMARMKAEKALLKNKLVSIDLQKKALEELRHK